MPLNDQPFEDVDDEMLRLELEGAVEDTLVEAVDQENDETNESNGKRKEISNEEGEWTRKFKLSATKDEDEEDQGHQDEDDDELDDEDLDLIEENTGIKTKSRSFKRLKRREETDADATILARPSRDLLTLFDEDEQLVDDQEEVETHDPARKLSSHKAATRAGDERGQPQDFDDEDDDLDDFIVDDDEDGDETTEVRNERRRQSRPARTVNVAATLGISNETWNDVVDLFGDGTDYSTAPTTVAHPRSLVSSRGTFEGGERSQPADANVSHHIKQIYEPAEVVERMFTSQDDDIRARDLPERIQSKPFLLGTPAALELTQECIWMLVQFKKQNPERVFEASEAFQLTTIRSFLTFLREDCLEIPFILHHRKDYCHPVFEDNDLWTLSDLNDKWCKMQVKRSALLSAVASTVQSLESSGVDAEFGVQDAENVLEHADTEVELNDACDYANLMNKQQITSLTNALLSNLNDAISTKVKFKRPVRQDPLLLSLHRKRFELFASEFCLSARQFGENLLENFRQHPVPEINDVEPLDLASKHLSPPEFTTPSLMLKGARAYVSRQICNSVLIRRCLRVFLSTHASISVLPTKKGMTEIDASHEYYAFKFMQRKPVSRFYDNHQFLLIHRAMEMKLVTVTVDYGEVELDAILAQFFLSDRLNHVAEMWNDERRAILDASVRTILIPKFRKEIVQDLLQRAQQHIVDSCCSHFSQALHIAPIVAVGEDRHPAARVLSLSCGSGDNASVTFGALVDHNHCLVNHIKFLHLHRRNVDMRLSDNTQLQNFLVNHTPVDAIVIGGRTLATTVLHTNVCEAVEGMSVPVFIARDDVASIYQNSKRARTEFPSFSPLLRYCVSLARFAQEPCFGYASLFNSEKEILFVRLHRLQVDKNLLLEALERVMILEVNQLGVDINRALSHPYAAHTLKFISGLGPRKSSSLLANIQASGGRLDSRADLVRKIRFGKVVFMNCASFIRISSRKKIDEVLDTTRIHPESYFLARKMAADALEAEEIDEDDENPSQNVEYLMDEVEKLNELMLEDFARNLEETTGERKLLTLIRIKEELQQPYFDSRPPFHTPDLDTLFTLMTGETDESLHAGQIMACVVKRVMEKMAVVQLDSGLDGVIFAKNFASERVEDLTTAVDVGATLKCCVLGVNKERFQVDLSCKPQDVDDPTNQPVKVDDFFDRFEEQKATDDIVADEKKNSTSHYSRSIQHPLYYSHFTFQMAESFLEARPVGEYLFRPSSLGRDHIALSWKVTNGIVQHVDVLERGKESEFTLGRELCIGKDVFGDLDEIGARFVDPMARHVRDLLKFQKFYLGTLQDLYAIVDREMRAHPQKIPYVFGVDPSMPGHSKPSRHEMITVIQNGFKFRQSIYKEINQLVNAFKRNPFVAAPKHSK